MTWEVTARSAPTKIIAVLGLDYARLRAVFLDDGVLARTGGDLPKLRAAVDDHLQGTPPC